MNSTPSTNCVASFRKPGNWAIHAPIGVAKCCRLTA